MTERGKWNENTDILRGKKKGKILMQNGVWIDRSTVCELNLCDSILFESASHFSSGYRPLI